MIAKFWLEDTMTLAKIIYATHLLDKHMARFANHNTVLVPYDVSLSRRKVHQASGMSWLRPTLIVKDGLGSNWAAR
jgi:hypothetical protein